MKSIALILLCFFSTFLTIGAQEINLKTWMNLLEDRTPILRLSIPATHDSGATLGGFSLKTQDCSVGEQLSNGIRGFDIRLTARSEKKLGVYHDVQFQQITWEDDLFPTFAKFLDEHPSETLWVSLKKEGGDTDSYCELLTASLYDSKYDKYIVKDITANLTLGDCRGKIIFSHRDNYLKTYPGVQCYDWPDNTTGLMTFRTQEGVDIKGLVEDEYQYDNLHSATYKAKLTWANMRKNTQNTNSEPKWIISFASATALPNAGPEDFAKVVNPYLVNKTKSLDSPCGIVLVDFSGTAAVQNLIKNLIISNLSYYSKTK